MTPECAPDHLFKIRSADGAWWEGEADPTGVNVKQFGAVGDGVTDDAPAIQAAVDYIMHGARGGTLILPFGQGEAYAIETTIEIDYSRVGTPTSMVMLHGTGMPDRNKSPAGTLTDKNMIIWTGAAGGTMLRLTDPLDHWLENFCLHGNDLADYCIEQSNTQGGWGHVTCSNIVLQRSRKNLVRYTGAVDGGRNLWWRCTLRKNSPLQGDDAAHNSATAGSTTWTLTDDPDLSGVVAGGQLYVATAGGDRKVYEIASVDDIVKTVTVVETDAPSVDSGAAVDYGIVPLTMQDEALVLYEGANNVEDPLR